MRRRERGAWPSGNGYGTGVDVQLVDLPRPSADGNGNRYDSGADGELVAFSASHSSIRTSGSSSERPRISSTRRIR